MNLIRSSTMPFSYTLNGPHCSATRFSRYQTINQDNDSLAKYEGAVEVENLHRWHRYTAPVDQSDGHECGGVLDVADAGDLLEVQVLGVGTDQTSTYRYKRVMVSDRLDVMLCTVTTGLQPRARN